MADVAISPYRGAMSDIRNIVILTGAGISIEASITAFRGPDGCGGERGVRPLPRRSARLRG